MLGAIDPGAAGGFAWVSAEDGKARAQKLPDTDRDLADLITMSGVSEIFLEDLVKYAGTNMPSSSMAVYASNWGVIKGICAANRIRLVLVRPAAWQKALGLGNSRTSASKKEWKNKLKAAAQRLFPHLDVTLATADALLILEYAKTLRNHAQPISSSTETR